MSDKTEKKVTEQEKKAPQELNFDDLDVVQGGSLSNVSYTSTSSISSNTRDRI